jgi:hypothetical protein
MRLLCTGRFHLLSYNYYFFENPCLFLILVSWFAVFDGHAGSRVSAHCAHHLLDTIRYDTGYRYRIYFNAVWHIFYRTNCYVFWNRFVNFLLRNVRYLVLELSRSGNIWIWKYPFCYLR